MEDRGVGDARNRRVGCGDVVMVWAEAGLECSARRKGSHASLVFFFGLLLRWQIAWRDDCGRDWLGDAERSPARWLT